MKRLSLIVACDDDQVSKILCECTVYASHQLSRSIVELPLNKLVLVCRSNIGALLFTMLDEYRIYALPLHTFLLIYRYHPTILPALDSYEARNNFHTYYHHNCAVAHWLSNNVTEYQTFTQEIKTAQITQEHHSEKGKVKGKACDE